MRRFVNRNVFNARKNVSATPVLSLAHKEDRRLAINTRLAPNLLYSEGVNYLYYSIFNVRKQRFYYLFIYLFMM